MNKQTIEKSIKTLLEDLYQNNADQEDIIEVLEKVANDEKEDFELIK